MGPDKQQSCRCIFLWAITTNVALPCDECLRFSVCLSRYLNNMFLWREYKGGSALDVIARLPRGAACRDTPLPSFPSRLPYTPPYTDLSAHHLSWGDSPVSFSRTVWPVGSRQWDKHTHTHCKTLPTSLRQSKVVQTVSCACAYKCECSVYVCSFMWNV